MADEVEVLKNQNYQDPKCELRSEAKKRRPQFVANGAPEFTRVSLCLFFVLTQLMETSVLGLGRRQGLLAMSSASAPENSTKQDKRLSRIQFTGPLSLKRAGEVST